MSTRIPAFLSFHVGPDAYQLGETGPATWTAVPALRSNAARATLAWAGEARGGDN